MKTSPILISACLLGQKVRYDGDDKLQSNARIKKLSEQNLLIPLCPEVSGGLPIPRAPAEIKIAGRNKLIVTNIKGTNVTKEFELGAENALNLCLLNKIKVAILTESSPSCGSNLIYDGSFSSTKIPGEGITTKLLKENGIEVFNEQQIDQAIEYNSNLINPNLANLNSV